MFVRNNLRVQILTRPAFLVCGRWWIRARVDWQLHTSGTHGKGLRVIRNTQGLRCSLTKERIVGKRSSASMIIVGTIALHYTCVCWNRRWGAPPYGPLASFKETCWKNKKNLLLFSEYILSLFEQKFQIIVCLFLLSLKTIDFVRLLLMIAIIFPCRLFS